MKSKIFIFTVCIMLLLNAAGCQNGKKGDKNVKSNVSSQSLSSESSLVSSEEASSNIPVSSVSASSANTPSSAPQKPSSVASSKAPDTAIKDDNFILDTKFDEGVTVFNPIKPPVSMSGRLNFGKNIEGKESKWILTQWNSKNNIIKTKGQQDGTAYKYSNEYKTVSIDKDGTVYMEINASKDYFEPRKTPQDPWAHLYFEQRYSQPQNIGKKKAVNVSYEFMIPFCKNFTPEASYDPGLHASIGVFYMTFGDDNPSSPGYNDFINFCMPLFDNRVDIPEKKVFVDSGTDPNAVTNKLIYEMDGKLLYNTPTGNGKWHKVNNFDIMPYIKEAFTKAKGLGCMQNTKFEDVALRSLFFGFENPGMFDTALKIKNMSVKAK